MKRVKPLIRSKLRKGGDYKFVCMINRAEVVYFPGEGSNLKNRNGMDVIVGEMRAKGSSIERG